MGLETENATPVWVALFARVDGETAVQETIGTSEYVVDTNDFGPQPDGLLVQATGGNIYFRLDGNPATALSHFLKSEDPAVIFPWVYGTSYYSFIGADANAHLIITPVTVH